MTDNQLIRLFLPIINAGLLIDGFKGVSVMQSNQPTMQGINTSPTVYFYKISDHRYGFLRVADVWDSINNVMVHTETQQYETTFQVSALVLQSPTNAAQYTASDLVNEVAAIMQSAATVVALEAQGVGILRIQDVANPYFMDDRDNFEASPSFDFVLTHKQIRVSQDPVVDSYTFNIQPV